MEYDQQAEGSQFFSVEVFSQRLCEPARPYLSGRILEKEKDRRG